MKPQIWMTVANNDTLALNITYCLVGREQDKPQSG